MKNVVKMFSILVMIMLLPFNASMSFAQGKGGTIKKGALYIGNMENPRQVAVNGTPAWIFSTLSIGFVDDIGKMITMQSVYSINTYTGGLGNALFSDKESSQFSYCVKDGNIYFWDWGEKEPQTESDYPLVLKIEDDYLTLLKTQIDGLKLSKLVYMGDCYKMKKMSEAELDQVEKIAFTSLLYLGVQETSQILAEDDNVYSVVEVMPEFPGGMKELEKYLSDNIIYPEEAKEKGISGRVFIGFIVEKDGSVDEVKVLRSIDPLVDNEAVRVVKTMPKWKPGIQKGKIVRVSYNLPILFK